MPAENNNPYAGIVAILAPPTHAAAITPNNDADLAKVTRAIYVGGDGDLKVTTVGGDTVTYVGLAAGTTKVGQYSRVFATGTTATNLIAEW